MFDNLEVSRTEDLSTLARLVWLIDGIVEVLYRGRRIDSGVNHEGIHKSIAGRMQIWKDNYGQDLIEYALMAGFVAVSAGAVMPRVASSISTIFSMVSSVLKVASTQGS